MELANLVRTDIRSVELVNIGVGYRDGAPG
jgi:hypothetical protein